MSKEFVMFYILCAPLGSKKLNISQNLYFFLDILDFVRKIYYDNTSK